MIAVDIVGQPKADLESYCKFYVPDNVIGQNRHTVW